jgi:hypothetical protein
VNARAESKASCDGVDDVLRLVVDVPTHMMHGLSDLRVHGRYDEQIHLLAMEGAAPSGIRCKVGCLRLASFISFCYTDRS